jgi:hypothetical protein
LSSTSYTTGGTTAAMIWFRSAPVDVRRTSSRASTAVRSTSTLA